MALKYPAPNGALKQFKLVFIPRYRPYEIEIWSLLNKVPEGRYLDRKQLIKSKFLLLNKLIISEIKGRKNCSITPVS